MQITINFPDNLSSEKIEQLLQEIKQRLLKEATLATPMPSLLLNGYTENNRPLHVVVAINYQEKRLIIITVYEPNSLKWLDNFSRRTL